MKLKLKIVVLAVTLGFVIYMQFFADINSLVSEFTGEGYEAHQEVSIE